MPRVESDFAADSESTQGRDIQEPKAFPALTFLPLRRYANMKKVRDPHRNRRVVAVD
jgi:hypothetical protein